MLGGCNGECCGIISMLRLKVFETLKKEKLYRIPTYAMTREQVNS